MANVLPGAGVNYGRGISGASMTAGQSIYLDSATNTLKLADANASATAAAAVGITAHAVLTGQPMLYYVSGTVAFGAILTVGAEYYAGATAGDIVPNADLATGWYVTRLGIATSSSNLLMDLNASGVAHA